MTKIDNAFSDTIEAESCDIDFSHSVGVFSLSMSDKKNHQSEINDCVLE
jgi:hypothetical protein